MVRLVVLIFVVISFLSACSSLPSSELNDPRLAQSSEEQKGSDNELIRLDEGTHHPAVQVLLSQAEEARQQGRNRQALSYLDQARQIQPRNSAIFYRQAWLNYQLGNLSQAQQLLQRAKLYMNTDKILQQRVILLQNNIDARSGL
ncbi:MAG: tetratricopeptide repeat protein [Oleispira sp.]|nr:tetratricopeptide repeat protein [Oleispira sp.]MBL4880909.1 tetratricopeptide repeat protein [Oleispira sp.]